MALLPAGKPVYRFLGVLQSDAMKRSIPSDSDEPVSLPELFANVVVTQPCWRRGLQGRVHQTCSEYDDDDAKKDVAKFHRHPLTPTRELGREPAVFELVILVARDHFDDRLPPFIRTDDGTQSCRTVSAWKGVASSSTRATCSLLILTAARASRTNQPMTSAFTAASSCKNLIATRCSTLHVSRDHLNANPSDADDPFEPTARLMSRSCMGVDPLLTENWSAPYHMGFPT